MTHSFTELNGMNREQLETLSRELDIKFSKKTDDENLRYAILDAEAKRESLKPSAEKPKRGRPRKAKVEEPVKAKEPEAEKAPAEEAVPHKRGRKKAAPEQPKAEETAKPKVLTGAEYIKSKQADIASASDIDQIAIATAIYLYTANQHDEESGILTIHHTDHSAWHAELNKHL